MEEDGTKSERPWREIAEEVSNSTDWKPLYEAALLETDAGKLPERITSAWSAILDRIEETLTHPLPGEHRAMDDALRNLRRLAESTFATTCRVVGSNLKEKGICSRNSGFYSRLFALLTLIQRCCTSWKAASIAEFRPMPDRALLVDDEPNILFTLGLVLKSDGFDVQTAESAQAAKTFLCETKFDLVVTDLRLEQPLSGFEIVRLANLQPVKPATVVISGFHDSLTSWKENGADAGLTKPTDVEELLTTIDRLLPHRKSGNGNGRNAA